MHLCITLKISVISFIVFRLSKKILIDYTEGVPSVTGGGFKMLTKRTCVHKTGENRFTWRKKLIYFQTKFFYENWIQRSRQMLRMMACSLNAFLEPDMIVHKA